VIADLASSEREIVSAERFVGTLLSVFAGISLRASTA
jgi:hypothetical protein